MTCLESSPLTVIITDGLPYKITNPNKKKMWVMILERAHLLLGLSQCIGPVFPPWFFHSFFFSFDLHQHTVYHMEAHFKECIL